MSTVIYQISFLLIGRRSSAGSYLCTETLCRTPNLRSVVLLLLPFFTRVYALVAWMAALLSLHRAGLLAQVGYELVD